MTPSPLPWEGFARARDLPPLANRRWGVLGLGVVGRSVAEVLAGHGAALTLADDHDRARAPLASLYPAARWHTGTVPSEAFADCVAVVTSPGVRPTHPALVRARARGICVLGELELLGHLRPAARLVCITGTNGKSTTTALVGALLAASGGPCFVGGNLGPPMAAWLRQGPPDATCVLEVSSYQLDALQAVEPAVGAVLNVTPDHLERYGDVPTYAASKARLVAQVAPGGRCILNADDPQVSAMAARCRGRVWWFGSGPTLPGDGLSVAADGQLRGHGALAAWPRWSLAHPRLLGRHNQLNAAAGLLVAHAVLAPDAAPAPWLLSAYARFPGLPHRLEPVGTLRGARWLNDSKATNDAAAATAIRAMASPYVLLLGGLDKGGGYGEVIAALHAHPAKAIVTFGAAAPCIERELHAARLATLRAADLPGACAAAAEVVGAGETVLLSPACASFDAFANYEARGAAFAAWVHAAEREPAGFAVSEPSEPQ